MDNSNSNLERITDSITEVISGVPAPIRKNFFKAFGQLCTAAVDVPVTWLEGKASEIKATYEARIQIIKKEGESISEHIEVPKEYIAKASEKFASKIIKEQLNLDEITRNAAQNLAGQEYKEKIEEQSELNDDWLNEFENYARLKSSDDMKLIFGKILSSEITKPGTFSIKTIRLISQLDNLPAKLFQTLCSQCISMDWRGVTHDARVVTFTGTAGSNSLSRFGLSFDNLNILQEYGLIISDYNSYMPYNPCIVDENNQVNAALRFSGREYGLIPTDKEKYDKDLKLHGVALTKAAKELLRIIPTVDSEDYKKELVDFLAGKHLRLEELK